MPSLSSKPDISVVVIVYNMAREAPRTLFSLSADYQQHIAAEDYEIIVVDNGSTVPLDPAILDQLDGNFRLIRIDDASPSPAQAINRGLRAARGDVIGVMIDGARLVTPGLLNFARHGARLYDRAVVASLGYYLGFDMQRWSVQAGYNAEREDALLAGIDWPQDGYRLFEIATPDGSAIDGWLQPFGESNALFLPRSSWDLLGGVEERFDAAGGGLLNLDMLRRALELPGSVLVTLLGEGSFHQLHGGIATNADLDTFQRRIDQWIKQYEEIRGVAWNAALPAAARAYIGTLPRPVLAALVRSAMEPRPDRAPPLGAEFDRSLWALTKAPQPKDPKIAAVMALAERQYAAKLPRVAAAVARLARARAPDEPAPQRLLMRAGPLLPNKELSANERAMFHYATGEAHRLLGEGKKAKAEFLAALAINGNLVEAHIGLSLLRLPGRPYSAWLKSFHEALAPEIYLEIGVATGTTIALAQPPTLAIGVDPVPMPNIRLNTQTYIFTETSDDFFAGGKLPGILAGRSVRLAFIDGLHVFRQALRDFINVERFCSPQSVVLLHDTLPLDERTQRPDRQSSFYTGDIWKTILCIKGFRPDLEIATIATLPSGLTMVTGLDPRSNVLSENYETVVARFDEMSYSAVENDLPKMLNVVPNDWDQILSILRARGIVAPSLELG